MPEFVLLEAYVRARLRAEALAARGDAADARVGSLPNAKLANESDSSASANADIEVGMVDIETPRCACASLARELALARVAALEAFDRARESLLERLARDVLARELALAPVDLAALAHAALDEFARCEPVALIVPLGAAARLNVELCVREDPALGPGDMLLEVRDGEIDARFRMREAAARRAALAD